MFDYEHGPLLVHGLGECGHGLLCAGAAYALRPCGYKRQLVVDRVERGHALDIRLATSESQFPETRKKEGEGTYPKGIHRVCAKKSWGPASPPGRGSGA